MKQNKSAKRSLAFSVLSLLLCCAMLVGTTFAWFTDSVTSGNNKIVAGNLDVELYHNADANVTTIENKVTETTLLFVQDLWEPGVAVFENFKVANEGTLALKYQLMINFTNAVKTPSGKTLADVLKVGVVENGVSGDRDAVVGAVTTWEPLATFALEGKLEANENDIYGVVIWWEPSDIDDEFNMNNENKGTVLSIDLGVSLIATQVEAESDAFGDDYDKDTTLPELTVEAEKLANELKAEDKEISIILTADVDLPISSLGQQTGGSGEYKVGGENTEKITIDLNGYKLNVTTTYWSSIGAKNPDAVFTIKNGTMTSSQATGTWNSYDLTFANCNYVVEDVVFDKAVAFTNTDKSVTMSNVTINETHDYYALWISARGQNVNIDGLTVNSDGRAIKIDEQYVDAPAKVTLNVSNATINSVKKAAITVKSAAGADIALSNVNIANTIDPLHAVWVDEDAAAYYDLVTVTGGKKILESDMTVSSEDLDEALVDGATVTLQLGAGTYTLPNVKNGTVTLIGAGAENTVVDYSHMGNYQEVSGCSFVFKDMTVVNAQKGYPYPGLQHTTGVSYENCHIIGTVNLFCDATFKNCTFDSKSAEHNVVTYSANNVTFEDCKFTYGDRSVNCYAENASARNVNVTFTDCEFTKVAGKATTGAIETNSCFMNSLTVTINNCTVSEGDLWFVATQWDSLQGAKTTVKVDGKYSFATGEQLRAFAANATGEVELVLAKDITLGNDTTQKDMGAYFPNATKVTIDGNNKTLTLKGQMPGNDWHDEHYAGIIAPNAAITVKDLIINNEKASNKADRGAIYTLVIGKTTDFTNVIFNGGINVKNDTTFTNCKFSETDDMRFALFVDNQYGSYNGLTVSVNNCTFNANGAHGNVKVADDTLGGVTLNIKDCTFTSANLVYPVASWNASKNYVAADVKATGKVAVNVTGTNSFTYGVMANVVDGGATYNGAVMTYNTIYGK